VNGPVVVVLEENHDYSSVIGNSAMPYLNGLATQYALATQYYADTHPSIGNYFMLTTGQILTNDDGSTATVSADNLVRHLVTAGKTWKSYAEDLPSVGYTGPDNGGYVEHHNPFSYFSDVRGNAAQSQNLVPFTQFQSDLNNGTLSDFSFVVPNLNDDAHDGTLAQADLWLLQNIAPVLTNAQFQNGGLLIVVFDEAGSDSTHGGGQVAMVMAGPNVKAGVQSSSFYQHENLLKAVTTYMGVDGNLGNAATAGAMSEFFK
jgi:acid phosphatase